MEDMDKKEIKEVIELSLIHILLVQMIKMFLLPLGGIGIITPVSYTHLKPGHCTDL